MRSWLLTYATSSLVLISGWRLIGATHLEQQWTPVLMLPHRRDGLSARRMAVLCPFLQVLQGSPRALTTI